jgi:ureidoglycolate hydrolase
MENTKSVPVVYATESSCAGLGELLKLPDLAKRRPDMENEVIRFWAKLGLIASRKAVEFGICSYKRRPFVVDRMEHHRRSRELLYAVDDDFIMPVAPNVKDRNEPDLSRVVALRLRRREGIVFAEGTWHWVPYPLKDESFALVGFALDTSKEDIFFHDLVARITMLA